MSWVWKAEQPLRTQEQCAREVHEVSLERGLDELASVMTLMCMRQEADFWCPANENDPSSKDYDHDSLSDDGRSVAYLQQQNGRPGDELPEGDSANWWGPMRCRMDLKCSVNTFQSRLPEDYSAAANDPNMAATYIQRVQRSFWDGIPGHPGDYSKHWTYCWSLLNRALAGTDTPLEPQAPPSVKPPCLVPNPQWRGDPLYLPALLEAFGVDVSTYTDDEGVPWDRRGHGDFGVIDYVVWHHTGSVNETDNGIAHHPTLGLAANMLVHEDGHVVLTGSGIAWHAGYGIWPGVPEDHMNERSIGIECAYSWGPSEPNNPWPDAQVQTMINIGGAISWFLEGTLPPDHQIAHKEWAGRDNPLGINKQGKPDPANFDMDWFRDKIAERAAAGPTGEEDELMGVDADKLNRAADKILGYPDDPYLRGRYPSRARTRPDNMGVDDGIGMPLWSHGDIYDLLTAYSAIEFADPDCIGRLILLANGEGPGARFPNGQIDQGAIQWAQGVMEAVKVRHPDKVNKDR